MMKDESDEYKDDNFDKLKEEQINEEFLSGINQGKNYTFN